MTDHAEHESQISAMFPTRQVRAMQAEGARIGLTSCALCGTALLIDPHERFDVFEAHRRWHFDRQEPT